MLASSVHGLTAGRISRSWKNELRRVTMKTVRYTSELAAPPQRSTGPRTSARQNRRMAKSADTRSRQTLRFGPRPAHSATSRMTK
jgi:hypothetical protein